MVLVVIVKMSMYIFFCRLKLRILLYWNVCCISKYVGFENKLFMSKLWMDILNISNVEGCGVVVICVVCICSKFFVM